MTYLAHGSFGLITQVWYHISMPKKHLSQNFLFDPSILERIAEASGVAYGETVVEIGPGPGSLTRVLADRIGGDGRLVAIEFDRDLYAQLRIAFHAAPQVELVQGDVMKYPFESLTGPFRVVANIPYHITTPIIFRLFEHRDRLLSMTLTVQKEVARRVVAGPGGKDYGVLSLMVQYYGEPEYCFTIPAGAFRPAPKVDSACLHVAVRKHPPVEVRNEALLFEVIRTTFSMRRKTILNSLKKVSLRAPEALQVAGIDAARRPETLSLEEFARVADAVAE